MKNKNKQIFSLVSTLAVLAVLATMITDSAYAQPGGNNGNNDPNAKARAIQNGESIDTENEGTVGSDINCVGGIDSSADAAFTQCYLLADGTPTPQYKTQNVAVQQGSASACPADAGFTSGDECFSTTFDASFFTAPGHYRFVIEFYNSAGQLIDIAGTDYRVHSFLVIPESGIGAIALVASSLAAFGGYYLYRSHKNPIPAI
jgi:hypothetical protein